MSDNVESIDLMHRPPTDDEIASAAEAVAALAATPPANEAPAVSGPNGKPVPLAPAVADLLVDLLAHVARGDMVTVFSAGTMLTTRQAADILNVSRPYLSKLLKNGDIPFIPVGSHRRVIHADLMAYKKRRDADRIAALDELARRGQEFDAS